MIKHFGGLVVSPTPSFPISVDEMVRHLWCRFHCFVFQPYLTSELPTSSLPVFESNTRCSSPHIPRQICCCSPYSRFFCALGCCSELHYPWCRMRSCNEFAYELRPIFSQDLWRYLNTTWQKCPKMLSHLASNWFWLLRSFVSISGKVLLLKTYLFRIVVLITNPKYQWALTQGVPKGTTGLSFRLCTSWNPFWVHLPHLHTNLYILFTISNQWECCILVWYIRTCLRCTVYVR